jgi:hypothetical protein
MIIAASGTVILASPGRARPPRPRSKSNGRPPIVIDDTDDRAGYCNLTFTVSGRPDIALDIQYSADASGSAGQCPGAGLRTATAGSPATISLDTDSRPRWLLARVPPAAARLGNPGHHDHGQFRIFVPNWP